MEDLQKIPPFDQMDDALRRRLLAGTETLAFRTGKALYYQGDRAFRACLVLEGRVRTVMYRSDETTLDLGLQGAGEWLGLPELVLGGPHLCDAVALEPCRILTFDRGPFARLRENSQVREWLLAEISRRYYTLHSRIELAQPGQRLARWLVEKAGAPLICTQDEVAAAVGTTRETVNRQLGRMQLEGLVRLGRGSITVVDAEGLKVWGGE